MLLTVFSACDDGKIYEEATGGGEKNTASVVFSGEVTGISTWPDEYAVVIAGFSDSDFAVISKPVTGTEMTMDGITSDITTIELCVINRLRKRVVSFAQTAPVAGAGGNIMFAVGSCDAGMYGALQSTVFDAACVQCHGGSSHAAAGLRLTASDSYSALVNIPSIKEPGAVRVEPGNAAVSVLWQALATGVSESWAYHHHTILSNTTSAELVKSWIDAGANHD